MSRKCQVCGAQLNSYNPGVLCSPCQEKNKEKLQEKLSNTPHYTLDDMCFLLGYQNRESMRRLARKGRIPGRVPTIRRHLYLKEVVDKWIHNSGRPPGEKRERHFRELSIIALIIVLNLNSYLDWGTGSIIGDVVYGGWLNEIHGTRDALSVEMYQVNRPIAFNLLSHLKGEAGEFPELTDVKDWAGLANDKITKDFVERLRLKANRGDFTGNCPACPS
jgi:hypothetical protein